MTGGRVEVRRAGDRALLVTPPDAAALDDLGRMLRDRPPSGVLDLVPAAETILLTLRDGADPAAVEREIRALSTADSPDRTTPDEAQIVRIGVRYDGPDLAQVARLLELTVAELILQHTARVWRCSFVGFTAGFGYLRPDRPGLEVPRRESPRSRVPPGSVALADGFSAVYPRTSPGGWQLIGATTSAMWDLDRAQPALLTPGTQVRFVDLDAS